MENFWNRNLSANNDNVVISIAKMMANGYLVNGTVLQSLSCIMYSTDTWLNSVHIRYMNWSLVQGT